MTTKLNVLRLQDKVQIDIATMVVLYIDAKKVTGLSVLVGYYENGREHGYYIRDMNSLRIVSFAENRNSDELVVYYGALGKEMQINGIPTNEGWRNKSRKYFKGDPEGCKKGADFIVKYLKGK